MNYLQSIVGIKRGERMEKIPGREVGKQREKERLEVTFRRGRV